MKRIRKDLTKRQREVLEALVAFQKDRGYPPTVRELGQRIGLRSPRSVSLHLRALEEKGYLRRQRERSRAIEVLDLNEAIADQRVRRLPLVGRVAAGQPELAYEENEGFLAVDAGLVGRRDAFLLRVKGESMIGAHIVEGDILVVERGGTVGNGDIVVVLVGDEATVKRLERRGKRLLLVAENEYVDPIEITAEDEVRIVGRVVALIRKI